MRIAERVGNLLGVPSCHFDPIFAREVRRAVTAFHPTAVAVELPPSAEDEVDWALSCWPSPVASLSGPTLFPFVPGDSIVEACRLACRFVLEETSTRTVVDPFCGRGKVLAVANALGMDAVGVEIARKRAKQSRSLEVRP